MQWWVHTKINHWSCVIMLKKLPCLIPIWQHATANLQQPPSSYPTARTPPPPFPHLHLLSGTFTVTGSISPIYPTPCIFPHSCTYSLCAPMSSHKNNTTTYSSIIIVRRKKMSTAIVCIILTVWIDPYSNFNIYILEKSFEHIPRQDMYGWHMLKIFPRPYKPLAHKHKGQREMSYNTCISNTI